MLTAAPVLLAQSSTPGGEGGIRTHGTLTGTTVFETARFSHSRTSPFHGRPSSAVHERRTVSQRDIRPQEPLLEPIRDDSELRSYTDRSGFRPHRPLDLARRRPIALLA